MTNLKRNYCFLAGCLLLIGLLFIFLKYNFNTRIKKIIINGNVLEVEIVEKTEDMQRGLGGRKNLCSDCGMLFVFPAAGKYSFWMKDMLFPLDIIWINNDKVVHVEKNIDSSFVGTLSSDDPANKVLEVNAGKSAAMGIETEDTLEYR